jgi:hypothetical protein
MENERDDSLDYVKTMVLEDQEQVDDSLHCIHGLIHGIILSIPIWGLIYLLFYLFL